MTAAPTKGVGILGPSLLCSNNFIVYSGAVSHWFGESLAGVSISNFAPELLRTLPVIPIIKVICDYSKMVHPQPVDQVGTMATPGTGPTLPILLDLNPPLVDNASHQVVVAPIVIDTLVPGVPIVIDGNPASLVQPEAQAVDCVVNVSPPVAGIPSHGTVYMPSFVDEFKQSSLPLLDVNKAMLAENWLCRDLVDEITSLFPSSSHIDHCAENKRDKEACSSNVGKMFFVGRIFASSKQLDQAAEMLLSKWGIKKVHNAKSIRCFFSLPAHRKGRKHVDVTKRRKIEKNLKEEYQCPFVIRYSYIGYSRNVNVKMPDIFYQVKITHVTLEHSCDLSTNSHRVAIQRSGSSQPNLDGMNDIISLLREKPMLSADSLRPLLLKYVPFYSSTDALYIGNFCRRAQNFLIQNGDREMSMLEAQSVSSQRPLAANEWLASDDPLHRRNFTSLLRKILSSDDSTWHGLAFLRALKEGSPGFDYRIKYDNNNQPEGLCWMSPEMRSDLLRYGNVIFLDAQKKQYNELGWPYIGPCVKDCDMKVRVVSECIIAEEKHEAYIWVMKQLSDMEPRFQVNQLKLIFADQFMSQRLLLELEIQETCAW